MFRIGTGIVVTLIGLWFVLVSATEHVLGPAIPGVALAILGIAILLNSHEDDIEQINDDNE